MPIKSRLKKKSSSPFISFEGTVSGVQKFLSRDSKPSRARSKRNVKSGGRPWGYFYLAALIAFVGGGYYVYQSDIPQKSIDYTWNKTLDLSAFIGLRIDDVYVEGRQNASAFQVAEVVKAKSGQPILAFNIDEIQEKLERIDWIKSAVVQRRLPGILYVKLNERKPIAVWNHQNQFFLVDTEGAAITPESLEKFKSLPLISGTDAAIHAPAIINVIDKFPEIRKSLTSISRIRGRRWDLVLAKGMVVKLPEENLEEALGKVSLLLEQKRINPDQVSVVDLRIPKQIILKLTNLAAVGIKMKGDET